MNKSILAALLLSGTTLSFANDEEQTESKYKWSGSGHLGFTSTSGNSDTNNFMCSALTTSDAHLSKAPVAGPFCAMGLIRAAAKQLRKTPV